MERANAVLFSLLMIVSSLAGCIGGGVDTSGYEGQIAELEEMLEAQSQTIAQRDATIDGSRWNVGCYTDDSRPCRRNCNS